MALTPNDHTIEKELRDLKRRISALERQQQDVGQLSELSSDMGLQLAGEFRAGNGVEPGEGFSGVRMTADGVSGYANDVLQAGLSATDGTLTAGAGAVILDKNGISIQEGIGASSIELGRENALIFTKYNDADTPKTKIYQYYNSSVGRVLREYVVADATKENYSAIALAALDSSEVARAGIIIAGEDQTITIIASGGIDITGNINMGDTGALTGGEAQLSDDEATSFTPARARGVLILRGTGSDSTTYAMLTYAAIAGTAYSISWVAGSNTVVTTGALSGTTGTDGKLTISAHTDGKIYIENRRGSSRAVAWQIVAGSVA